MISLTVDGIGVTVSEGSNLIEAARKAGLDCENIGKHPMTKNGVKDATTDLDQIRKWWQRWPNANIGVATGSASGIGGGDGSGTGRATATGCGCMNSRVSPWAASTAGKTGCRCPGPRCTGRAKTCMSPCGLAAGAIQSTLRGSSRASLDPSWFRSAA